MRRTALVLAGWVLVAVVLRAWVIVELADEPLVRHAVIDARQNLDDARYLAEVSWAGPPEPYWKPPLYAYALAVLHAGGVGGPWGPRGLNVLLDVATILLLASLGARLWSPRVGLVAAALGAVYGPLVYFTTEITSASLTVTLVLASVRVALWAWEGEGARRFAVAGAVLGVAALARAEVLVFAPLVAVAVAVAWRRTGARRARAVAAAAWLGGVALAVTPVTVRNATVGGDAVLISANGGVNLFIGVAPEHRGMIGVRPCTDWERLVREPERSGITRAGAAHSAWFTRRAAAVVAADPGGALARSAGKVLLVWHGHELASNLDPYRARRASHVLAALLVPGGPVYVPFGLVAPLALAGLALAVARRHRARALAGVIGVATLTTAAFFVTARFRLPLAVLSLPFAAWAVLEAWAAWRRGARRGVRAAAAGVVALAVLLNHPGVFAGDRAYYAAKLDAEVAHYEGTVRFAEAGDLAGAERDLRRARALDPRCASTALNLGQVLAAAGRAPEAFAELVAALAAIDDASPGERMLEGDVFVVAQGLLGDPAFATSAAGRGLAAFLAGDLDAALGALDPGAHAPLVGRAALARGAGRLLAGELDGAAADLATAQAARPRDADTRLVVALLADRRGDADGARAGVAAFRALEWPRGALYRRAVGRGSVMDRALVELVVRVAPDDALAREASRRLGPAAVP